MAKKKNFADLTERGKAMRLAKYAKERTELSEKYGTEVQDFYGRIVAKSMNENSDGSVRVNIRLNDQTIAEGEEGKYKMLTAFVPAGKQSLESFYAGLKPGNLVTARCVPGNKEGHFKVWNVFLRTPAKAVAEA